MSDIIVRSRIGMWSAFNAPQGPVLNARDASGETVTVLLDDDDVAILSGDDVDAVHRHADHLVASGRHLDVALPTPAVGFGEPAPHESRTSRRSSRLEVVDDRMAA